MAESGFNVINGQTGEIVDDPIFSLSDELYDPNDIGFKMTANFKNNKTRKRNVRIYRVNDEEQTDNIDVNTEYDCENIPELNKSCIFTKLYRTRDPHFSKDSYYKYWHKLCSYLNQDTNVIFSNKPNLHKVRHVKELEKLCEGSHPSIYKFVKECMSKGLIAEFKLKGEKEFVVNPRYALNGKKMPVLLYNLFNENDISAEFGNDNCDTNE
ncbi:hypothetical protein LCGC14_2729550 [marine sediment metagenome]|uniref:Uncharacterized protein n=1 Tax=marine sediment metagenome TaxID=412755 RepID=A0A0F8Z7U3_9ZZZZ